MDAVFVIARKTRASDFQFFGTVCLTEPRNAPIVGFTLPLDVNKVLLIATAKKGRRAAGTDSLKTDSIYQDQK